MHLKPRFADWRLIKAQGLLTGELTIEDDMPDVIIGDGLCNAIDPDDDGDGYLDPVDENNIQPGEDAFKWIQQNNSTITMTD